MNQMTVHFINNSTGNPTSYLWDFGDGSSSTLKHPSHTYANNGTYSVLLSIWQLFRFAQTLIPHHAMLLSPIQLTL